MPTPIPCLTMRGGTETGLLVHAGDPQTGIPARDRALLAAVGSPGRPQPE